MQHRLHLRPARKQTSTLSRNRVLYAGLALAVIACGLLWRSGFIALPQWLSNNGGDALPALTLSWGLEISQLYHARKRSMDGRRAVLAAGT